MTEQVPIPQKFVGTVISPELDQSLQFILSSFLAMGLHSREASRKAFVEYALISTIRQLTKSEEYTKRYRATFGVTPPEYSVKFPGEEELTSTFEPLFLPF